MAPVPSATRTRARVVRGLALASAIGMVSVFVGDRVGAVSPLLIAMLVGVALTNTGRLPATMQPGLKYAGRTVLRLGVVLLGFRLGLADVISLGGPRLAAVVGVASATFFGTRWMGRKLDVHPDLSLLVATGSAICGASAIAAVDGVIDADEDDVAVSITAITLCGTLAVLVLPVIGRALGLGPATYGTWVGAGVHDVGQVVAAAGPAGASAVAAAVVVKLTRVVLLAPLVAGVAATRRTMQATVTDTRPPILPGFVVGFLVAVAIRSAGVLSAGVLGSINTVDVALLATAMVGLGANAQWSTLRRTNPRIIVLALGAWMLIAVVALVAAVLV